jgi:NAD(P)-dependent dehydrogenase (short-subunit alcohol dehydrogenase family)
MTVAGPAAPPARRFGNTVSLVTGAGGGIGGAIAERLAAEGSRVIVCDVDAAAADAVAAGLAAAAAHQRHRTRIRAAQRPGVRRCPGWVATDLAASELDPELRGYRCTSSLRLRMWPK